MDRSTSRPTMIICLCIGLAAAGTQAAAQTRGTTEPQPAKPPTVIVPPKPSPPPAPPPAVERSEPKAEFCCTAYGRFGPVGGSGRPGAPCQVTLPSSVAQGSTCQ